MVIFQNKTHMYVKVRHAGWIAPEVFESAGYEPKAVVHLLRKTYVVKGGGWKFRIAAGARPNIANPCF